MTTISAAMVKDLRVKTGAGMMDCKTALTESGGDAEAAIDWLRTKGLSKAAKKEGRVAAEGLVGIAVSDGAGAVVEVNSETDFVARNENFQVAVKAIAEVALSTDGEIESVAATQFPGADATVGEYVTSLVATIGENLNLRRSRRLSVGAGTVAAYVHNAAAPNLGRIGVLVALESSADKAALDELGRRIAMHIAAASPLALSEADLGADVLERERLIFSEQAKESGKPENVIEKMVEGRIRKFMGEVVLLKQSFVMDPDKTIEKLLAEESKTLGVPVAITAFERFVIGEGIEKEVTDFAAEVAATAKS